MAEARSSFVAALIALTTTSGIPAPTLSAAVVSLLVAAITRQIFAQTRTNTWPKVQLAKSRGADFPQGNGLISVSFASIINLAEFGAKDIEPIVAQLDAQVAKEDQEFAALAAQEFGRAKAVRTNQARGIELV